MQGSWVLLVLLFIAVHATHEPFSYLDKINHYYRRIAIDNAIAVRVNTTLLERSGDAVTVTWTGVSDPKIQDYIAAFSPGNVSTVPIRYVLAATSKDYLITGRGEAVFTLVNQRAEYVFAFLRGGFDKPTIVATSETIKFKYAEKEPTGAHLSLTQNENEMRLMWTSGIVSSPVVTWGTQPGQYTQKAAANTTTYKQSQMCGPRASTIGWRDPGFFHTAIMTNLTPGQKYYYIYGDSVANVWSDEHVLYTPHDLSATHVIVYGDMGHQPRDGSRMVDEQYALNTTRLVVDETSKGNVDLVLHIGDISYARGYTQLWDEFLYDIEPISSRVPYMTAIGNHEADYPGTDTLFQGTDSGGECGVAYDVRFPMTRPTAKYPDRIWYSFDLGYAHYLIIDTEHNFTVGSPQYQFIEQDLKNVDRTKTPWVIVNGHRPQYISSTNNVEPAGDQPVARELRKNLDPLYLKYGVDLAFWGHHHSYQRTCPVNQEVCIGKGGTVHVVVGSAGAHLSFNIQFPKPKIFDFVENTYYGYGRMRVSKTELAFEFVSDHDGNVKDSWTLHK